MLMIKNNTTTTFKTHKLLQLMGLCCGLVWQTQAMAQSYSYTQAEQHLLENSYITQTQQALHQASALEAEAVKGLGLPRVDLNARAYAFHSKTDVPLNNFKQNLEEQLSQRIGERMSELESIGVPSDALPQVEAGMQGIIHDGLGQLPDYAHLTLEDQVFRPTISVSMPIYTGGLTQSAKNVANINLSRSQISAKQQQDLQRFELIQRYFAVQLQHELLLSSRNNLKVMQKHLDNAYKLEQQGFISKGQRMLFEVARNNAERLLQASENSYLSNHYQLRNLLQDASLKNLDTPLFVNYQNNPDLDHILASFSEQSPLLQKLRMDTQLANEKVKVHSASTKPKVFAFGEYALDNKENWIVGVMASYNLFSGLDKNKQIQAAELQRHATELITEKTEAEISNIIFRSYHELQNAQRSHLLLKQNMLAAQENLRIQSLSFQEDMGTATQVIDAENAIYTIQSETALNAYKYVLSLATLLQSQGQLAQFQNYLQQPATDYIGQAR